MEKDKVDELLEILGEMVSIHDGKTHDSILITHGDKMSALDDFLHNLEVYQLLPASVEDGRKELANMKANEEWSSDKIVELSETIAQLRKQNVQLTDALYKEAKRSVKAFALIQRVLYAKGTDTLDRLNIKPFLEWVEAFPKPPALCEHGNKPEKCAHCHPRWD